MTTDSVAMVLQIVGAVLVVVAVGVVAGIVWGVMLTGLLSFAAGYAYERR